MKTVNIIGLGYIGLPTATAMAMAGYRVFGVDVDPAVVSTVNAGKIHIEEPGLQRIVAMMVHTGRLSAHTTAREADAHVIAVPTPLGPNDTADLSYVVSATVGLLPVLRTGDLIVLESTVSPGTTREVVAPILDKAGFRVGTDIYLAHCPERVLPGRIMEELIANSRIIGGYDPTSARLAASLYAPFVKGDLVTTDATTAELAKLVENTYRDLNIAFANELVKISKLLKVDANEVIGLANKHPRVNILQPGPGVGGHCLAVDPYFIVESAPQESCLIATARAINRSMPHHVVDDLRHIMNGLADKKVAVFGLTYKANVDDTREAPSWDIVKLLENEGATVACYDPHVKTYARPLATAHEAVKSADCLLLAVDHAEFKHLDISSLKGLMRTQAIYDAKNVLGEQDIDMTVHRLGNYTRSYSKSVLEIAGT